MSLDISVVEEIGAKALFEKRRWSYFLMLPMMWMLIGYVMIKKKIYKLLGKSGPKINTWLFDGLGLSCRQIKESAASWKALDIIYNHQFGKNRSIGNIIDDFWIGMMNAQSVRNRLKLVKQEIRRAILQFNGQEEIRLVSLACGSAQAIIEVMAELKEKGIKVRAILLDIDQTALDYALDLAERYQVASQIKTMKANVSQIAKVSRDFKPHIVEMLGFLDYFPQDSAIKLAIKVRESLDVKGVFLTCNICHNPEEEFLKWVINWPMIYRSPNELAEVAIKAGFDDYRLIYEPLKIHGIIIAQKSGLSPRKIL